MFLSFTAAGRNWNESERNASALRPMFNGRSAAANGAEKSFTPEREAFLIYFLDFRRGEAEIHCADNAVHLFWIAGANYCAGYRRVS